MQGKRYSDSFPTRNVTTHQEHRREVLLQVTVPLVIGILIIGTLCVLPTLTVSRGGDVGVWADISLIFLIILTGFFAIFPLALIAGITYGVTRLYQILPPNLYRLQIRFEKLNQTIKSVANRASQPIIRTHGFIAQTKILTNKVKKPATFLKASDKDQNND